MRRRHCVRVNCVRSYARMRCVLFKPCTLICSYIWAEYCSNSVCSYILCVAYCSNRVHSYARTYYALRIVQTVNTRTLVCIAYCSNRVHTRMLVHICVAYTHILVHIALRIIQTVYTLATRTYYALRMRVMKFVALACFASRFTIKKRCYYVTI